jgi:putative oxidoreductase
MHPILTKSLYVGGRILLASLFLLAGLNKIINYTATAQLMAQTGLSPSSILLPAVIALELGGGALIAFGSRQMVWAAFALAAYTLATNFFFHRFWEMAEPEAALQLSLFFKNIAIMGALLHVGAAAMSRREP